MPSLGLPVLSKALRQIARLVVSLLTVSSFAVGQVTLVWTGNSNTDWANRLNWVGFLTPNANDNAVIDTNGTIQPLYTGFAFTSNSNITNVIVGNTSASGTNTELIVQGQFTFADTTIGNGAGSTGAILVNGTLSELTGNPSDLQTIVIGAAGNGTLDISNGGNVSSGAASIGNVAGSNGNVAVNGAGSIWTVSMAGPKSGQGSNLTIGSAGNGALDISNGGEILSGVSVIGSGASSNGSVVVDGVGST